MKKGFTLAEMLIVVAILAVLAVSVMVNWQRQVERGFDIRRKADLAKIRKAFEEYYNDFGCYPPTTILNNCGSTGTPTSTPQGLSPYIPAIPCDPGTKLPYKYEVQDPTNICKGYIILAGLSDKSDPDISALGCDAVQGCGYGAGYNYGLAAGGQVKKEGFVVTGVPTPSPTASSGGGALACSPDGMCRFHDDPSASGCPSGKSYPMGTGCVVGGVFQCSSPANRCTIN